jgi:hypothetical protein
MSGSEQLGKECRRGRKEEGKQKTMKTVGINKTDRITI